MKMNSNEKYLYAAIIMRIAALLTAVFMVLPSVRGEEIGAFEKIGKDPEAQTQIQTLPQAETDTPEETQPEPEPEETAEMTSYDAVDLKEGFYRWKEDIGNGFGVVNAQMEIESIGGRNSENTIDCHWHLYFFYDSGEEVRLIGDYGRKGARVDRCGFEMRVVDGNKAEFKLFDGTGAGGYEVHGDISIGSFTTYDSLTFEDGRIISAEGTEVEYSPVPFMGESFDYGDYGSRSTWALYDNGTLIIWGDEAMDELEPEDRPWGSDEQLKDRIRFVKIAENVKSVGSNAFTGCRNLKIITILEDTEWIGESAFSYCGSLTEVNVPANVKVIRDYAFEKCDHLRTVTIEDGMRSIHDEVFAGCPELVSVTIPASVVEFGHNIFDNSNNVTVYCYAGSAAEQYAKDNNVNYVIIG